VLSIDRLIELKGVIKWNAVFSEAGLNPNTMRSAVHHQRELREEEASAILEVLKGYGLEVAPENQGGRRGDRSGGQFRASRSTVRIPVASHV
jgi:hypothetical protein